MNIIKKELLEIVNDEDEVIGLEERSIVHQKGLLHREVHVWFITPNKEIIFQHRAKDKDTWPDKLDATVGGHVEPGMSYDETAIKEIGEETGIKVDSSKLKFLRKVFKKKEVVVGPTNYTIRAQYFYLFEGKVADLKIEPGKSLGFEAWEIDQLHNLNEEDRQKFIPMIISKDFLDLFDEGQKVIGLLK